MFVMTKPLGERVQILQDDDWEEIRQNAYAMVMYNDRLDLDVAELHAMMAIIEAREAGVRRILQ